MKNRVVARCFENNRQELQQLEGLVARIKQHVEVVNREAAASLEEAQKADLFQGEAEGGTAEQELIKWEPWSELAEALQEQVEVKKVQGTGGTGAQHVCGGKPPQSRHGMDS
ncbi:uncharacterized protein M6G45_015537 isoform 3-T3 [Spheniscus humboldti]